MTPVIVTFMSDEEEVTLGPFNQGVVVTSLPSRGGTHFDIRLINVADDTEIARSGLFGWDGWTITSEEHNPSIKNPRRFGRMFVQAHNPGGSA